MVASPLLAEETVTGLQPGHCVDVSLLPPCGCRQRDARHSRFTVVTEEPQRLRVKFYTVLLGLGPIVTWLCAVLPEFSILKPNKLTVVGNKTVKLSMLIRRASRSAVIEKMFLSTHPPQEFFSKDLVSSRNHNTQAAASNPLSLLAPSKDIRM